MSVGLTRAYKLRKRFFESVEFNAIYTSIWEPTASHMVGFSPLHVPSCVVACLVITTFAISTNIGLQPGWHWDGWPLPCIPSGNQSISPSHASLQS